MAVDHKLVTQLEEKDLTQLPKFVGLTRLARRADRSGQTLSHWIAEGRVIPTAWLDTIPIWSEEDAEKLLNDLKDGRPEIKHTVVAMPTTKKIKRVE